MNPTTTVEINEINVQSDPQPAQPAQPDTNITVVQPDTPPQVPMYAGNGVYIFIALIAVVVIIALIVYGSNREDTR